MSEFVRWLYFLKRENIGFIPSEDGILRFYSNAEMRRAEKVAKENGINLAMFAKEAA